MKTVVLLLLGLIILPLPEARAEDSPLSDGQWQVGLTFGEIPLLAGSFKPGLTFGYHLTEQWFLGFDIQATDHLQRDANSFNAANAGFDGLSSSTEITGRRSWLGLRFRPTKRIPFVSLGIVFNGTDTETMVFDRRERTIQGNTYDIPLTITQARPRGHGFAIGLGYQYDFPGDLSLHTGIALALLSNIPDPSIDVDGQGVIDDADCQQLIQDLSFAFKDNIHNHYHIFNIGMGYRFN